MNNAQARKLSELLNQLPNANGTFRPILVSGGIWGISASGFIWERGLVAVIDDSTMLQNLPDEVVALAQGIISNIVGKK